jgi:hypothetical protein
MENYSKKPLYETLYNYPTAMSIADLIKIMDFWDLIFYDKKVLKYFIEN